MTSPLALPPRGRHHVSLHDRMAADRDVSLGLDTPDQPAESVQMDTDVSQPLQTASARQVPHSLNMFEARLPFTKLMHHYTQEELDQDPTLRRTMSPASQVGHAETSSAGSRRATAAGNGTSLSERSTTPSTRRQAGRIRHARTATLDVLQCEDLDELHSALRRTEKALSILENDDHSKQYDDRLLRSRDVLQKRIMELEQGRGVQEGMSDLTLEAKPMIQYVNGANPPAPRRLTLREKLALQEQTPMIDPNSNRMIPLSLKESTQLQQSYEVARREHQLRCQAERLQANITGIGKGSTSGASAAGYWQHAEGLTVQGSRPAVSDIRVTPEQTRNRSSSRVLAYLFGRDMNENEEEPSIHAMMYDSFDEESANEDDGDMYSQT